MKRFLVAIVALLLPIAVLAEDLENVEATETVEPENVEAVTDKSEVVADNSENKIVWTVDIGTVTIDGKQWNRLSVRPDIPIGKFGICLDLELFVDDSGQFSDKGWKFNNGSEAFESISRKIYYLRWGRPNDKIYAKVGSLDNVSLGYGLIMYGYSNALQYPDIRKTGLHFELNDMSPVRVGIQGMINNFQDFQNGGALIGSRLYVKPLTTLEIPILSNLTIAGSYVADLNQRAVLTDADGDKVADWLDRAPTNKDWAIVEPDFSQYDTTNSIVRNAVRTLYEQDSIRNQRVVSKYRNYIDKKDPFAIVGFDIGLPILRGRFVGLDIYGQYAKTMDTKDDEDQTETSGWGITAPGAILRIGKLFSLKLEYRYFKDQFEGEYFDRTYELNRMMQRDSVLIAKEELLALKDSSTLSGIFGRANFNIVNVLDVGASYQWMKFTSEKVGAAALGIPEADQSFTAEAKIGKTVREILNKVKIDDIMAYYSKKNIGTWIVGDNAGKPVYDKFLEATPFVLMGYKLGFKMSESMILYWDKQYTYAPAPTDDDPYKLALEPRFSFGTQIKF